MRIHMQCRINTKVYYTTQDPKPQREKQDRFHHQLLSINTPVHTKQIGRNYESGFSSKLFYTETNTK